MNSQNIFSVTEVNAMTKTLYQTRQRQRHKQRQKERYYNIATATCVIWCITSYIEIVLKQCSIEPLSNFNLFVVLFRFTNELLKGGIF